jgi:hypothetical protein
MKSSSSELGQASLIDSVNFFLILSLYYGLILSLQYGFRLPPSQPERDVFYDIRFPMNSKIFTYPS